MTIKNITIFDLDGTVIDSSHRQATLPDGTLNLAHWFENATPEKIFKDKILPLAQQIRKRSKAGDYTMICTARTLSDADLEFFHHDYLMRDAQHRSIILHTALIVRFCRESSRGFFPYPQFGFRTHLRYQASLQRIFPSPVIYP